MKQVKPKPGFTPRSQICVMPPKVSPSAAHKTARAPIDARRKFHKTLAGKLTGTSSTGGSARAAKPATAAKTAAETSAPFQEPSLAEKASASVAARIMARREIASMAK